MRHGHPFPTRSSLAWPAPSLAALAAGLWVLPQANPRTRECEPAVSSCLRFGAAGHGSGSGRPVRRLIGAPTAPPLPCCAVTNRGFTARGRRARPLRRRAPAAGGGSRRRRGIPLVAHLRHAAED